MNRPNILLITTDQQRFDTIAALGNNEILTPHLNWLADEGVAFTRCYSDCPICMPARATMMTGLPGYRHGLVGNTFEYKPMEGRETFPALLTRAGYQTRAEGKLHFSPMRANYGIEHADLPMDYFNQLRRLGKTSTRAHGVGENEMEPVINPLEERDTLTHWTVEKSMDFLENRDPTRPFFLWTSFAKPHPPLDPCLSYWELYRDAPLSPPVLGDWSRDLDKAPLGFYRPTFQLNNLWRLSEYQKQQVKRAYYACITQIDYNLGLLFARMRELELLENTWIIFTSDHGDMLGDHNMGAKSVFFEGSAHVPFLIKPPAVFGKSNPDYAGLRCGKLITLSDLMPTILSLCSVEGSAPAQGVDLLQYLRDDRQQTFYGNSDDRFFAVIEGWYKYTWAAEGGSQLFFDLEKDPYEQHDLSGDPAYSQVLGLLRQRMIAEMEQSSPQVLRDGEPVARPCIHSHSQVPRFPGLNTTLFPRDSFH